MSASLALHPHRPKPEVEHAGPAVEVRSLAKRFGRLRVLCGVDISFGAGRTTALVGPNAAGKSTLLKCILGLARPDAGTIAVDQELVSLDPAYRRFIGYMPQAGRLPEHLTGREVTAMLRDLRHGDGDPDEDLFTAFQLEAELDKPTGQLSGGTRQKLLAALAVLFRPRLLVLDEPTAGLDPIAAGILKDKIAALRHLGTTVIVTGHVLAEMEELAQDVALLLDGRARFHGPLGQLREETGETRLERAVACLMSQRPAP